MASTDTGRLASPDAPPPTGITWRGTLLLGLATLLGAGMVLSVMAPEFPMDDSYIHFQYAKNFAATGRMEFNLDEFRGLGTTSLLWVLLLAGGIKLGITPETGALFLGIMSVLVCALCVHELVLATFRRTLPRHAEDMALGTGLLCALSGNMLWFAVSGMETTLCLALALCSLVAYGRGRYGAMGIGIGLTALCRPDGLALLPAVFIAEVLRVRAGGRARWGGWALAAVLVAIPVGLWLVWLHGQTGHWLPTSFAGKRICQLAAIDRFIEKVPWLGLYGGSAQALYVVLWVGYTLMYLFGVGTVPGPAMGFTSTVGTSVTVHLSYPGIALAALVMVPLLVLGARELCRFWRAAGLRDFAQAAVVAVWTWALFHNLAYLAMLPTMGTTSRYQAINHILIWWLVALGIGAIRPRRSLYVPALAALCLVVACNLVYWRGTYEANVAHMRQVRIAAARYLATELPPGARVAAFDIGALRYFGQRTIVDLGGLTDTEFTTYQKQRRVDRYLKDREVDYLALPEKHSTDPEALFDFARYLGIDHTPMFDDRLLAEFETDRDLWLRGMEATGNYQPAVRVRKVNWRQ